MIIHSQDDKANIVLGLPATNKKVTVFTHMEHGVHLSDHDITVAPMNKLIKSVTCATKRKEAHIQKSFIALWVNLGCNQKNKIQSIWCFGLLTEHKDDLIIGKIKWQL